jgi:hypothetical protein
MQALEEIASWRQFERRSRITPPVMKQHQGIGDADETQLQG